MHVRGDGCRSKLIKASGVECQRMLCELERPLWSLTDLWYLILAEIDNRRMKDRMSNWHLQGAPFAPFLLFELKYFLKASGQRDRQLQSKMANCSADLSEAASRQLMDELPKIPREV
uniref:Uncharacterized protein n=1 Tax=Caenorhabditis japonica TaxID=281687 RepID=A0A8R1EIG1_CAEJA